MRSRCQTTCRLARWKEQSHRSSQGLTSVRMAVKATSMEKMQEAAGLRGAGCQTRGTGLSKGAARSWRESNGKERTAALERQVWRGGGGSNEEPAGKKPPGFRRGRSNGRPGSRGAPAAPPTPLQVPVKMLF